MEDRMNTTYIRFIQMHNDPVWGKQALPWMTTPLIRVTRNNKGRAVFEWVGKPNAPIDIDKIRRIYPLVVYA
jgi:hypothetical protein